MKKIRKKIFFLACLLSSSLFFFNVVDTKQSFIFLFLFSSILLSSSILYRYPDKYINPLKRIITNFTVLLVSIFFSIISVESYLHIITPSFLETNRSILGNFTDFTLRGYLDESVFNKKKDVFRILGLGDSFATNLRYESKNYHNFLQTMFDRAYKKRKIEIINAGMETVGPGYYSHILEKYGDLIKPDLVLVGFTVGNDFMEMGFNNIQISGYIYEPRDIKKRFLSYFRFKNFRLYQFLKRKGITVYEDKKRKRELSKGVVKEIGSFSRERFLKIVRGRMRVSEKHRRYDLENLWNQNSKTIIDIKKWCDKGNVKLILAILPDQYQVEQDLRQEVFKQYGLQENSIDLYYPNKLLSSFCKQSDIHCVDLLDKFQENAKFQKLYRIRDTHWNEEGNKLAAEVIFDYIENNKFIRAENRI